jgi:nitrite reductase (NADH) small subunit
VTDGRAVRLPAGSLAAGNGITICEVGGHRVGVIRIGGELHAVADRCPHRGAPICSHGELVADVSSHERGTANGSAIEATLLRCPWHKWDYDPTTGVCPVTPKFRLKRYHVWEDGDDVVVSLDPRPAVDSSATSS